MSRVYAYQIVKEESPTGSIFVAWFPQIPGLRAQAILEAEAVNSLFELLPRYLEAMKAIGAEIGEPKTELTKTVASFTLVSQGVGKDAKATVGTASHLQPA